MTAAPSDPSHEEIQEFLGVYALDAVDADTAAMVERHLAGCIRCSIEVAQHHEVAGLLANSGGASPVGLWSGIASQLDGTTPPSWERLARRLGPDSDGGVASAEHGPVGDRQVGDRQVDDDVAPGGTVRVAGADGRPDAGAAEVVAIDRGRRKGSLAMRAAVIVAAAAAAVAVILGVQVNHLHHQVNALQAPSTLTRAEQVALQSPSTKKVVLTPTSSATGSSGAVTVVLTRSGTGFVEADKLSALPGSETYQLWGVIGQHTISLGLMGRNPTVVPFSVAGGRSVEAFAITAEHAGGVIQTTNRPVVAGEVTA